ncbi:hypothetical protein [Flindersiella endophytica]
MSTTAREKHEVPYPHSGSFQPYAEGSEHRERPVDGNGRKPGRLTNLFRRLLDNTHS